MYRKEDIVVFALYQLGGTQGAVHIEDLAVKCHELSRSQFSWQLDKYSDFPDIKTVYYAVDAVSRGDESKFVQKVGDRSKGGQRYRLTRLGLDWVKKYNKQISADLSVENGDVPKQEVLKSLQQLKSSNSAFLSYKKGGEDSEFSIYEFADFLGCSVASSRTAVREKFSVMENQAVVAEDPEIMQFLNVAKNKFPEILASK